MIINDDNLLQVDLVKEKARVILKDESNRYIVCKIGDNIVFPGGDVESNESYYDAVYREMDEELGTIVSDLEELITINYYHKNFINLRDNNSVSDRLNIVHYFYKRVDNFKLGEKRLTDYEINNGLEVRRYTKEELRTLINLENKNEYKKFTDKELMHILDYLDKRGY